MLRPCGVKALSIANHPARALILHATTSLALQAHAGLESVQGPSRRINLVSSHVRHLSALTCAPPGRRAWNLRAGGPIGLQTRSSSTASCLDAKAARHATSRFAPASSRARTFASKSPPTTPPGPETRPIPIEQPHNNNDAQQLASSPNAVGKAGPKGLTARVRSSLTGLTPHENIYNVPNVLTATRLVAAPVLGYLIVQGDLKWALALFFYAGVTDLIDGWWARTFKVQTVVGSVIDPMADKMLMTVMTVSLAVKGLMPVSLATLILGRDVALAVAAIYYRYASLPAPKTLARYWDFSLPSAEVHPTTVSKYNTFLQLVLIGATLALPVLAAEPSSYNHVLEGLGVSHADVQKGLLYFQFLVAGTTAWSGLSYAFLKDAVKILGQDEVLKAKQGARGRAIIGVLFGGIVLVSAWLALFKDGGEQHGEDDEKSTA